MPTEQHLVATVRALEAVRGNVEIALFALQFAPGSFEEVHRLLDAAGLGEVS